VQRLNRSLPPSSLIVTCAKNLIPSTTTRPRPQGCKMASPRDLGKVHRPSLCRCYLPSRVSFSLNEGVMLEYVFPFHTYIPNRALPRLFKSVLVLLSLTLHLVYTLILFILPSFSLSEPSLSLLLTFWVHLAGVLGGEILYPGFSMWCLTHC